MGYEHFACGWGCIWPYSTISVHFEMCILSISRGMGTFRFQLVVSLFVNYNILPTPPHNKVNFKPNVLYNSFRESRPACKLRPSLTEHIIFTLLWITFYFQTHLNLVQLTMYLSQYIAIFTGTCAYTNTKMVSSSPSQTTSSSVLFVSCKWVHRNVICPFVYCDVPFAQVLMNHPLPIDLVMYVAL